jgi:elongation factor P--beta-lysine ligase
MKNLQPLLIREQVIKSIRKFFDNQGFREVITPVLNRSLPLEPNIYSFETKWAPQNNDYSLYLQTSPEMGLKKLLASGMGNCYTIAPCFRNLEGSGPMHTPEFLMLEWYRENSDYQDIMHDTKALVLSIKAEVDKYLQRNPGALLEYQSQQINLNNQWQILSLVDLFSEYAKLNLENLINDDEMKLAASKKDYVTDGASWEQLFDQIYLNEIEPHLPKEPFFVTDFPARLSPLCTINKERPFLANRFEFFMFGIEIGNGNNENTNKLTIKEAFQVEENSRIVNGQPKHEISTEFLEAIDIIKDKSYAGIGLGVDRLAMIFADTTKIKELDHLRVVDNE